LVLESRRYVLFVCLFVCFGLLIFSVEKKSERDDALFRAGFPLAAFDPRRLLGSRDSMIDELKRAAVPSSFKVCSSGASCRSQDRLTLSIARNRLCSQCYQRFCAKCMEESVLLEGRWLSPSPVCFSCAGEVEQERQMLMALHRSNKFSDPPHESSEETACRHVLRLAASVVQAARLWQHFPFVRTQECRANLLFLPESLVPLDFFWESAAAAELLVHLPFCTSVKRMVLLAPTEGWSDTSVTLRGAESGVCVASAELRSSQSRCELLVENQEVRESVLRLQFGPRAKIARVLFEFAERGMGGKARDAVQEPRHNSFEIFGKKSSDSKSASSKVSLELLHDTLVPLDQRVVDPCKREVRNGNTIDFWLVKQRNSVEFAGGFAMRLVRDEQPQYLSVRAHSVCLDEKGDYKSSQVLGMFLVPAVSTVSVVWFALPLLHQTSCISLEVICPAGAPPTQLWLTANTKQ
jgi:hypothetical protein